MKLAILCILILSSASLPGSEVRFRFLDDERRPLAGVSATIIFVNRNSRGDVVREGRSDAAGLFSAVSTAEGWIRARAKMEGRYGVEYLSLDKSADHDLTAVMRGIRNPIPLYADRCAMGVYTNRNPPPVPIVETEYAYDLELGEMMPPHGQGRTADVRVRARGEFLGWTFSEEKRREEEEWARKAGFPEGALRLTYGRWRFEHELTFPGRDCGLIEVSPEDFLPFSELKLPHHAPESGYQPVKRHTSDSDHGPFPPRGSPTTGYFVRTRVRHDAGGRIVSAHYAKIIGEVFFGYNGGASFHYCFNPTPNDRNLEFDPLKNLFDGKKRGASGPFR